MLLFDEFNLLNYCYVSTLSKNSFPQYVEI